MRVHMAQKRMTFAQADTLLYYLHSFKYVTSVQVRERTGDAIICYVGDREAIIDRLRKFHYEDVEMPEGLIENSGRKVNQEYQDKLVYKVLFHYARKFLLSYCFFFICYPSNLFHHPINKLVVYVECAHARIYCRCAKLFFDA